jgi:hypothetical protein
MAVRVRVAGSGTLVAWKVPWPDISLTEERLLSAVSPLGDMVGHARSYHMRQSSHGGKLIRPEPRPRQELGMVSPETSRAWVPRAVSFAAADTKYLES